MSVVYSFLLILLLCHCMHACNARPFGFENAKSEENGEHQLDSVQVSLKKTMTGESSGDDSAMIDGVEDLKAVNERLSGNGTSSFSSSVTAHRTSGVEVSKKGALSRVGFGSDGEKAIGPNLQEGFLIDYEAPHHSPPIHNRRR